VAFIVAATGACHSEEMFTSRYGAPEVINYACLWHYLVSLQGLWQPIGKVALADMGICGDKWVFAF